MLSLSGLRNNLAGAWAVMNGHASGLSRFDLSIDGFWRSFGAVVLIVPVAIIASYSEQAALAAEAGEVAAVSGGRLTLSIIARLIDWFAFPIVFAWLAKPLGLAGQYVPFIIVRNWAAVIISAAFGVVHLGYLTGFLPSPIWLFALLVLFVLALRFAYMIARTVLAVPVGLAIPIVLLEPLLSLLIELAFDRIAG